MPNSFCITMKKVSSRRYSFLSISHGNNVLKIIKSVEIEQELDITLNLYAWDVSSLANKRRKNITFLESLMGEPIAPSVLGIAVAGWPILRSTQLRVFKGWAEGGDNRHNGSMFENEPVFSIAIEIGGGKQVKTKNCLLTIVQGRKAE